MKTKTFSKRLKLKKQTIATLKDQQMTKLKGGACTCDMTGCRTWIWQECSPSYSSPPTECEPCGTITVTYCC